MWLLLLLVVVVVGDGVDKAEMEVVVVQNIIVLL